MGWVLPPTSIWDVWGNTVHPFGSGRGAGDPGKIDSNARAKPLLTTTREPCPGVPGSPTPGSQQMTGVRIMGIVNVTPDSFSGDGLTDRAAAIARGLAMAEAGAAIVDVGGESTRPGHEAVPADEEIRRAVPVVAGLARAGVTVSIDTSKLEVAAAAADAVAAIVNDFLGLRRA